MLLFYHWTANKIIRIWNSFKSCLEALNDVGCLKELEYISNKVPWLRNAHGGLRVIRLTFNRFYWDKYKPINLQTYLIAKISKRIEICTSSVIKLGFTKAELRMELEIYTLTAYAWLSNSADQKATTHTETIVDCSFFFSVINLFVAMRRWVCCFQNKSNSLTEGVKRSIS